MSLLSEWGPERKWGNCRPARLASILGNLVANCNKENWICEQKADNGEAVMWLWRKCGVADQWKFFNEPIKTWKKGYGLERVYLYIAFGYWQFIRKSFIKGLVDLSWHGKKGKILLLTNNELTGRKQTVGKVVSCHDSERLLLPSFRDLYVHNINDSLLIFLQNHSV